MYSFFSPNREGISLQLHNCPNSLPWELTESFGIALQSTKECSRCRNTSRQASVQELNIHKGSLQGTEIHTASEHMDISVHVYLICVDYKCLSPRRIICKYSGEPSIEGSIYLDGQGCTSRHLLLFHPTMKELVHHPE